MMKKSPLKILLEFFGTVFLFALLFALIDLSEAREGVKLTEGFFLRFVYPDYLVFSVIAGLLYTGRQIYKRVKFAEERRSITNVVLESLAIAWLIAIFLNLSFFLGQLKYLSREYYAQIFLLRFGHHPTYFTVGAVVGLGYGIMELYRVSLILKKSGGRGKVVFL